jgi:hypothetical protein
MKIINQIQSKYEELLLPQSTHAHEVDCVECKEAKAYNEGMKDLANALIAEFRGS